MIEFPSNPTIGQYSPLTVPAGAKQWKCVGVNPPIWDLVSTPSADAVNAQAASKSASDYAAQAKGTRDQALTLVNVYPTIAEGIAAGVPVFDVPINANYNDLIRYKNVSGGAVEFFRYQVATAIMNYWGISPEGEVQFRPDAVASPANCALYEVAPPCMFVDRFGQTPVTALGDLVGLQLPVNVQHGPPIITDPGFDTGTGWTFNAGWARTGGKAVATATNSTLRWLTAAGVLVAQRRYWLDMEIVITSGTLTVNIGSGTALTIPGSGVYRFYPQCGGAPTGGLTFTGTAFTGSVDNTNFGEASPFIRAPATDAERGTYELDPFTGAPRINMPAGKHMKTESRLTMGVPTYICAAIGRDVATSLTMLAFGAGAGSITFVDNTSKTMSITSARSGVFASPNTRTGQFPVGVPKVVDCYVEAGWTSAWPDGGRRDVQGATGLASGAKRKLANTFVPGDSYPNAYYGVNYTTGGVTAANSMMYGDFIMTGVVLSEAVRMKIIQYFRNKSKLAQLDRYEYDGFLHVGQSNKMGAPGTDNPLVPPFGTAVEYIDTGALKPVHDPAQHSVPANVSIYGSDLPAMSNAYYNNTGRRIMHVGSAYSGEGLVVGVIPGGTWLGPNLVKWAAHKFKNAMRDYKMIPRAAIFAGGEQDATHPSMAWADMAAAIANYEGYLIQLRDYIRKETGLAWLPIIIHSLDDSVVSARAYEIIRTAQANVCANVEGFYMGVPFQNYLASGHLVGNIHLDQFALDNSGTLMGNYAAAMFTQ